MAAVEEVEIRSLTMETMETMITTSNKQTSQNE